MLKALKIEGLRGVAYAELEELAPLTIMVGPNGSAKSTVLEAAGVACAGNSAPSAVSALMKREWLGISGLGHVISSTKITRISARLDHSNSWKEWGLEVGPVDGSVVPPMGSSLGRPSTFIVMQRSMLHHAPGTTSRQGMQNYRVWVDDDGNLEAETSVVPETKFELIHVFVDRPAGAAQRFSRPRFSSALREALGQIKLSPLYDAVFSNIQALRPSLVSIESVPVGDRDEPFMFERTGSSRVGYPVAYAGDGFRRTLLLAAGFAAAEKGVVAIDEPDAFAHPTMFERLAGLIRRSVDQGTQVIYATHSMEFVGATLRAFQDKLDTLAVFGLQLVDGRLDHVRIPGADAERRVHELGHDLRL